MTTIRNSLGVCVHSGDPSSPYTDPAQVSADLARLGITRVRDRGTRLCGTGLHVTCICWSASEAQAALQAKANAVEGPNEWNLAASAPQPWPTQVRQVQADIWQTVDRQVPVYGPSPGLRKDHAKFGDLTAYLDRGSAHLYMGADSQAHAGKALQDMLVKQQIISGQRPDRLTETGWHNDLTDTGGVSEAVAAVRLVPWLLFCWLTAGVDEIDLYELYDEPQKKGREAHYGLIESPGGRIKPVGVALQRFLADHGDQPPESIDVAQQMQTARDLARQLVSALG